MKSFDDWYGENFSELRKQFMEDHGITKYAFYEEDEEWKEYVKEEYEYDKSLEAKETTT